jgi:hypothetical protein
VQNLGLESLLKSLTAEYSDQLTEDDLKEAIDAVTYFLHSSSFGFWDWKDDVADQQIRGRGIDEVWTSLLADYRKYSDQTELFQTFYGDMPLDSILSIRTVINTALSKLGADDTPLHDYFADFVRGEIDANIPPQESLWVLGIAPFDSTASLGEGEAPEWPIKSLTDDQLRTGLSLIVATKGAHLRAEKYLSDMRSQTRIMCVGTD